jgi:hypothetical protein
VCEETKTLGLGLFYVPFSSRGYPVSVRERQIRGHVASLPAVCIWAALLPRQGGGRTIEAFDDNFFDWWSRQILAIEDYPYVGINFSRDPDMPVPPGVERGEIGMFVFQSYLIFISFYIYHFYVYQSI